MTSKKRRYFDVIDSDPTADAPAADPGPHHVGDILRERREALGYSLPDLAANLRIRLPYLEAIEQGDWAELPGQAYVVGFLRTYAAALGLEPGPVLTRFKQDTAGIEQPAELYFPEPVNENRMPGGMLILVAVLLAAVAYGTWYVVGSDERGVVERVQELPERMAGLIPGGPEQQAQEPAPAPVLAEPDVQALIGSAQPTAPEVGASNAPAGAQAPVLPPDAPSAALAAGRTETAAADPAAGGETSPVAEESEVPQLPPDLTPTISVDAEGRPVVNAEPAPTATAAAGPAGNDQATTATPAPADGTSPAEAPAADARGGDTGPETAAADVPAVQQAAPAASGRVFGQTEGDVRVTVRAVEDSWVEIRDARGTLWAARNLRPGDVFRAPDVPGLTLNVVGNAAGVVLSVDGRELPPLGGRGQVVRDVSLVPADVQARLGG